MRYLERESDHLKATLDGLGDCDVRRPTTPTGTSLLGLVKHVAGHADIIGEAIDGRGGAGQDERGDAEWWQAFVAQVQAQADAHRWAWFSRPRRRGWTDERDRGWI